MRRQAAKGSGPGPDAEGQEPLAALLAALRLQDAVTTFDVAVVGCGPGGLGLAAALAAQGLRVALVGQDAPWPNNYGVWADEFEALGLAGTLDRTWADAVCYFGEGREVRVGRAYARVARGALRAELARRCREPGPAGGRVEFLAGTAEEVEGGERPGVALQGGGRVAARLVVLATGAAGAGRHLRFEGDSPQVGAQTAYGIEVDVEDYPLDPELMLFMDYRRHHSGVWGGTALKIPAGEHPNAGEGNWGAHGETPSFLYAMPVSPTRVFFEETCLAAKDPLPFEVLKRRLHRRLDALGIRRGAPLDEEWSYIPVGGPLPLHTQGIAAFGAAAGLVHPATGYSVARSLTEAERVAAEVAGQIKAGRSSSPELARSYWGHLWNGEKRRQAAFNVFGMELLAAMDTATLNMFFNTFFRLPAYFWRGFLSNKLSSVDLVGFALLMFVLAPVPMKLRLVAHLVQDPSGAYLIKHYAGADAISGEAASEA